MRTIGFVTYAQRPDLSADDRLAVEPLRARGISVVPVPWDAPGPMPACDGLVLRSCWNYHLQADAFSLWLAQTHVPVHNPTGLARWNLHKRYLAELASKGATLPRTLWFRAGESVDLAGRLRAAGIHEAVVKPAISLSAYKTWRVRADVTDARTAAEIAELVAERDVMVQEFVPEIETEGELSFIFLGGSFSHAIRKLPKSGDFRSQSEHGGKHTRVATPPAELLAQADRIFRHVPGAPALLYARVDGIPVHGRLVLMEVELLDPTLFLSHDSGAPDRFAAAIDRAFS